VLSRRGEQRIRVEVPAPAPHQGNGVRLGEPRKIPVGLGGRRDQLDPHPLARLEYPRSDLTAVGQKDATKH
jgi:hypothetical protein